MSEGRMSERVQVGEDKMVNYVSSGCSYGKEYIQ